MRRANPRTYRLSQEALARLEAAQALTGERAVRLMERAVIELHQRLTEEVGMTERMERLEAQLARLAGAAP